MRHLHRLLQHIRTELGKPSGQARLSRQQLQVLIDGLERLLQLRPYVRHDPDCGVLQGLHWKRQCTCGLDQHLSEPPSPQEASSSHQA